MTGYVFITPQGCATDHRIDGWIGQAVDHVSTLTPSRRQAL